MWPASLKQLPITALKAACLQAGMSNSNCYVGRIISLTREKLLVGRRLEKLVSFLMEISLDSNNYLDDLSLSKL